jgi:ketosteroid isomerase-like protein
MVDAWNSQDIDTLLGFLTDDVVWTDPAMPAPCEGRAAVAEFSRSVLRAFPDFQYSIRGPICTSIDGQHCAVPWRIVATHTDRLEPPGYGPTGRTASFEGVDLLTFAGDKISRIETLFDVLVPAEQLLSLRIRPPVGTVRERIAVLLQRLRAAWLRTFGRA